MIISNSKSYIFVHIMKAAGTSVTSTLDQSLSWNDVIVGGTKYGEQIQWPYMKRFGLHKHSQAREIKQVVGDDIWDEYFTFAFVRNPYTRAVSLYTFIEKMIKSQGFKRHFRSIPFSSVKKSEVWSWPGTVAYLQSNNFSEFIRNKHYIEAPGAEPQANWIKDENGEILIDFVGKVENIQKDFQEILCKIGINIENVEKKNTSKKKKQLNDYFSSEDDYRYLYELYKDDFETFGYDSDERL